MAKIQPLARSGVLTVGIDGSGPSRTALVWAAERALALHGQLVLAAVGDSGELAGAARWVDEKYPTLDYACVAAEGDPVVELVRIAAASDLLVVGTHKTGFIHGRVFGSLSLRVVVASTVPVAVIPDAPIGRRRGVVVGVDASDAGREAILFAAGEAAAGGDDLTLLLATGGRGHPTMHPDAQLELSAMALRIAETAFPDIGLRMRSVRNEPAQTLVEAAIGSRLLVVGSSRRHLNGVPALGPVTFDALVNITSPIIVVHPAVGLSALPVATLARLA